MAALLVGGGGHLAAQPGTAAAAG